MGNNPSMHDSEVRNSLDNLPKIWSFVSDLLTSPTHKLFVMSDSSQVLQSARNQTFQDRLVLVPGRIIHVDRDYGGQDVCGGFEKLMLEQHMLMNCDVLIQGESGLSALASFIRGTEVGLYCLRRNGDITPCHRDNDDDQEEDHYYYYCYFYHFIIVIVFIVAIFLRSTRKGYTFLESSRMFTYWILHTVVLIPLYKGISIFRPN